MNKKFLVFFIIAAILSTGCMNSSYDSPESELSSGLIEESGLESGLSGEIVLPYIEENDTVEIGEMI